MKAILSFLLGLCVGSIGVSTIISCTIHCINMIKDSL